MQRDEDARRLLVEAALKAERSETGIKERQLHQQIRELQESVDALEQRAAASESKLQETVRVRALFFCGEVLL